MITKYHITNGKNYNIIIILLYNNNNNNIMIIIIMETLLNGYLGYIYIQLQISLK